MANCPGPRLLPEGFLTPALRPVRTGSNRPTSGTSREQSVAAWAATSAMGQLRPHDWRRYGLGSNAALNQIEISPATRTTFIPDIQGSMQATLASATGTLAKAGYLPFGQSAASTGTFRYTGQRIDPETGLYYYRARMYAPRPNWPASSAASRPTPAATSRPAQPHTRSGYRSQRASWLASRSTASPPACRPVSSSRPRTGPRSSSSLSRSRSRSQRRSGRGEGGHLSFAARIAAAISRR